jgi:hypothetical protein
MAALGASCSSAPRKTTPELSKLEGRRVALVEIQGEATARRIAEVALINQLTRHGSFILVSKQDVEAARARPNQDPRDWQGLAREAGAEVALRMDVLQFDADTREGISTEQVQDSQLKAEQGGDGTTERVYKVRSLDGHVRFELEFADLAVSAPGAAPEVRKGVAEAQERVVEEARTGAAHLPPKLRFLEKISNQAFADFFERYH